MRKHVETIMVSLLAAGLMGLLSFYVQAQSTNELLTDQVASHDKRISALEETAKAISLTQARIATTQEMIARWVDKAQKDREKDLERAARRRR